MSITAGQRPDYPVSSACGDAVLTPDQEAAFWSGLRDLHPLDVGGADAATLRDELPSAELVERLGPGRTRSAALLIAPHPLETTMHVSFIAGFGPVARSVEESHGFWAGALGLPLEELAPGYHSTEKVDGARAFAVWPLTQAAESVFGSPDWPTDLAEPQAWLEVDVATPAEVADAVAELEAAGHRVLRGVTEEPWGQTTSRLLSPEGLLVGVTYTPWMHESSGTTLPDDGTAGPAGAAGAAG